MVRDRTTDGTRLAELLASEVHARGSGPLGELSVSDAVEDVDPTEDGTFVYALSQRESAERASGETARLATVHVHPDRLHVEFERGVEAAADAGRDAGLRVRPKAVQPPRSLVFVEDGAEVKRACDVLAAVVESLADT